jgi:hypothetical protein
MPQWLHKTSERKGALAHRRPVDNGSGCGSQEGGVPDKVGDLEADKDRRDFLKATGKFAAIVPPAMILLLSTSMTARATVVSGGSGGPCSSDNAGNCGSSSSS